MRPLPWILALVLLAGCTGPPEAPATTPPTSTSAPAFACPGSVQFRPADLNVVVDTSKGAIRAVLFGRQSPISVCNFLTYAEEDFYDGTVWHRICPHVIQAGGQDALGRTKAAHPSIKNEAPTNGLHNYKGTLGYARDADPDSASTDWFVNLRDNVYLDADGTYPPGYAVFGNVTAGWDVVEAIAGTTTLPSAEGCDGKPVPSMETTIRDITVETP